MVGFESGRLGQKMVGCDSVMRILAHSLYSSADFMAMSPCESHIFQIHIKIDIFSSRYVRGMNLEKFDFHMAIKSADLKIGKI